MERGQNGMFRVLQITDVEMYITIRGNPYTLHNTTCQTKPTINAIVSVLYFNTVSLDLSVSSTAFIHPGQGQSGLNRLQIYKYENSFHCSLEYSDIFNFRVRLQRPGTSANDNVTCTDYK